MATRQRRQASPARGRKGKYADGSSRREKELQRELDEKAREVNDLKVALSKAKADAKDADTENAKWQETVEILEEKQQVLQKSVKRQAGAIEIFEANDRASGKRFQLMLSENLQLRAANKKLLAAQEKIATEVRLQMNKLLALHPDETDTDTTEQLDREKDVKNQGAAEADSSDSESEVRPAPASGALDERKEQEEPTLLAGQMADAPAADRSLSAETLPMSPRMPPTDMPEPSTTQPMSFEPAPAQSQGQETVSAVVQ